MKKLTLIICEGLGDKRVLNPLFPQSEYIIIHGDFITDESLLNHEIITEYNVLKELNNLIINSIAKLNISTKITLDDIDGIVYVTDSDKCFESNSKKARVLKKLAKCRYLKLVKKEKEFKLLVFSNNLEHLFLNEPNHNFKSDKERRIYKTKCAKKIVFEYTNHGFDYTCKKLESQGLLIYTNYGDFSADPSLLIDRKTNLNVIKDVI